MSKKFKIQCYGDSLTAGLTEYEFHPYSISLQEELIKLGVNAEVLSTGLSDWTSDPLIVTYADFLVSFTNAFFTMVSYAA